MLKEEISMEITKYLKPSNNGRINHADLQGTADGAFGMKSLVIKADIEHKNLIFKSRKLTIINFKSRNKIRQSTKPAITANKGTVHREDY